MAARMVKIKTEDRKIILCQLCRYQTDRPHKLKRHVKAVHAKIKDHVCSVCGRGFTFEPNLRRHMSLVHLRGNLTQEKKYFCPQCEHGFWTKYDLRLHTKSVHF